MKNICPLCNNSSTSFLCEHRERDFYLCPECKLIFVSPQHRLTPKVEKSRYDFHQNSPKSESYRKFLSNIYQPILEKIKVPAEGLDYGCGPGPTLSVMFEESGFKMNIYDYFYEKNEQVLEQEYDFITSTEVVEHLYEPKKAFTLLYSILKQGGWLGIMTKLYSKAENFKEWFYKNDDTHVCFYSRDTFIWLGKKLGFKIEFINDTVILLHKK